MNHITISDKAASMMAHHSIHSLYKDPMVTAFIELLANAMDVHRSQDIQTPITPIITGEGFGFRDYGAGIDNETARDTLFTLGSSSKLNDNQQQGHFGIGAKSALAYADTVQFTLYNNGIESVWLMLTDAQGPRADLLSQQPCDTPNGCRVFVPWHKATNKKTISVYADDMTKYLFVLDEVYRRSHVQNQRVDMSALLGPPKEDADITGTSLEHQCASIEWRYGLYQPVLTSPHANQGCCPVYGKVKEDEVALCGAYFVAMPQFFQASRDTITQLDTVFETVYGCWVRCVEPDAYTFNAARDRVTIVSPDHYKGTTPYSYTMLYDLLREGSDISWERVISKAILSAATSFTSVSRNTIPWANGSKLSNIRGTMWLAKYGVYVVTSKFAHPTDEQLTPTGKKAQVLLNRFTSSSDPFVVFGAGGVSQRTISKLACDYVAVKELDDIKASPTPDLIMYDRARLDKLSQDAYILTCKVSEIKSLRPLKSTLMRIFGVCNDTHLTHPTSPLTTLKCRVEEFFALDRDARMYFLDRYNIMFAYTEEAYNNCYNVALQDEQRYSNWYKCYTRFSMRESLQAIIKLAGSPPDVPEFITLHNNRPYTPLAVCTAEEWKRIYTKFRNAVLSDTTKATILHHGDEIAYMYDGYIETLTQDVADVATAKLKVLFEKAAATIGHAEESAVKDV